MSKWFVWPDLETHTIRKTEKNMDKTSTRLTLTYYCQCKIVSLWSFPKNT